MDGSPRVPPGGSLSHFEFLFSLYGLLLGLGIAELVNGFSRAYDKRKAQPIGWLAPGLGALLISDLLTFWFAAWRYRDFEVTYHLTFAATTVGLLYYFAASQVFPREGSDESADDHAMPRRKLLALLILSINLVVFIVPTMFRMFVENFSAPTIGANAINATYVVILAWVALVRNKKWAAVAAWCGAAYNIAAGPYSFFMTSLSQP